MINDGYSNRYLARMPPPAKMKRGIMLIETLEKELQFVDYGQGELAFGIGRTIRTYPDWRTNPRDYAEVISLARSLLRSGVRVKIESQGYGGIEGTQLITLFTLERRSELNYGRILEKATDAVAERLEREKPSEEEADRIIREFIATRDESNPRQWKDLEAKLGIFDKEKIRERLQAKLQDYLRKKQYTD